MEFARKLLRDDTGRSLLGLGLGLCLAAFMVAVVLLSTNLSQATM